MITTFKMKALLFMIPILVAVSLVYTYESIRTGREIIRKEIIKRAETITTLATKTGELPILSGNPEVIADTVSFLRTNSEVSSVAFFDSKMALLIHDGPPFSKPVPFLAPESDIALHEEEDAFVFYAPVFTVKTKVDPDFLVTGKAGEVRENIGWVRLGFSKAAMTESQREIVIKGLRLALVFTTASSVAVYFLISLATRPLLAFTRHVEEVPEKTGKERFLPVSSHDEIGKLTKAFNNMVADLDRHRERIEERSAELEQANRELQAEIAERKRTEDNLKKVYSELEISNKELKQFTFIASHDLQEPLRMVSSYLQLLESRYKGKLDKEADRYIAFAVDGAKRMRMLIEDLLIYSRLTRQSEFSPVDLNLVFTQAVANLSAAIAESQAVVSSDDLPTVLGNETQLMQLFQNLISNAIKFSQAGIAPLVRVCVRREAKEWVLAFSDNGIGIGPEYFDKIFQIFQRLHTREEYPGTGIGLTLCKKIVESHHGRIWLESIPGEGTTFFVTIPA